MNKLMVSIAAGLLGMATSAMAADMPVKAPKRVAEVEPVGHRLRRRADVGL